MKCWEQGDIDQKVILSLFLTCVMTSDGGMGMTYTGLLGLSWSDFTEKAWNQTLRHLTLPGLKIGDEQHTTPALGRHGSYLTFRASL